MARRSGQGGGATNKRSFEAWVIENVRGDELNAMLSELQSDSRCAHYHVLPEGDGEYTVVAAYRADG
ncbi:MAG: hypothetical protein ACTS3F_04055 [Phycisphaerales bacterium]